MNPEDKKYILENIGRKNTAKISQELDIKERNVRKFLEKQKKRKIRADTVKEETGHPLNKKVVFLSAALIIVLGFVVYANSLKNKFVYDDDALVLNNNYIRNWSHVANIFKEDVGSGAGRKFSFYRPLQVLTYVIDYSFWKLDPTGYHLTNVLLHILAALCVYWFINILFNNKILSLFTGIFFVIHPIHTEAVTYVSGRSDSLGLIFMLITFIFYIKTLRTNSIITFILMISSYILALLSRENVLILPALLGLYHYSFKEKFRVKEFMPILIIACIYIILRLTVLKFLFINISTPSSLPQRLPGLFVAITNYIKLLLLPFGLHMEYSTAIFNFTNPLAIAGIAISVLLLTYSFKLRNKSNLIFFSISWFFIALLPVSNLYSINAYMAEHWLYVPSIGFFLIMAKGLSLLYTKKRFKTAVIVFVASLLVFYSYLTIRQNDYWREPLFFYKRTLEYAPYSVRIYYNLGNTYCDLGRKKEALDAYKKAIAISPNHDGAYNNLGNIYLDLGRKEEALAAYKKVLELNPHHKEAYNNLGNIYNSLGRKEEAIAAYKKGLELNPNYATYYNLGGAYNEIGRKEEAMAAYKKVIELKPDFADAYESMAVIYYNEKQYDLAIEYCDKAIALGHKVSPDLIKYLEPFRNK